MTTTERSLDRVRDIIDCYLEQGLTDIFLRPLSPYGFAIKTKSHAAYDVERWLDFYKSGLDYILELNARGVPVVERYASLILKKMLTNADPGYVDLMSPAGIGISVLVYNYDGDVFASDEARMLGRNARHIVPSRQRSRPLVGRTRALRRAARTSRRVVHAQRTDVL